MSGSPPDPSPDSASGSIPDPAPDSAAEPPGPPPDRRALLRRLPKIDALLDRDDVRAIDAPRWAVRDAARAEVDALRAAILAGTLDRTAAGGGEPRAGEPLSIDEPLAIPAAAIAARARALCRPSLVPVINATGVVLHTNLGRAPLAADALAEAVRVAAGYSNLEYDLDRGARGSRHGHLAALIRDLTGAEDAVCVNNNAGAVMLALSALAAGREVIVSRGELVEIGGSFRIPDVMRLSGATLVEVGTTNKTRAADYEAAIGPDTALLLKVHQSNFAVVGFTEEASIAELAALAARSGARSMMDLGSGSLLSAEALIAMGLPAEPGVRDVVAAGVDLVTFSGDKLLGGPQAGILCGRADAVAQVRRHPLMRAMRPDKVTMALLAATLAAYRDGRAERIPALAMLAADPADLRAAAEALRDAVLAADPPGISAASGPAGTSVAADPPGISAAAGPANLSAAGGPAPITINVVPCESTVGGGAMPLARRPSWAVALTPAPAADVTADAIAAALRAAPTPIICRVADGAALLDLRTVPDPESRRAIATALAALVP